MVRRVQALIGPAPEARHRRFLGLPVLSLAFGGAVVVATAEFAEVARAWL